MMNTKTITVGSQMFDVPVSSKGTVKGEDIIRAAGAESGQTVYRASEDGHEVIQASDEVSVQPGDQFNATPRFITASRNVQRVNQELRFLIREYGDDNILWPPSLEWVLVRGYKLPKGYNFAITDMAIMIPDNYGNGAPLRDCFVDPNLRYSKKGEWVRIGHYFDAPDGHAPSSYQDWKKKNWSYLCLHMEEWKPQHTVFTYMNLAFTYLSNPFYPWKGNESQARSA